MSGKQDKSPPRWKELGEVNPCFCQHPSHCGKPHLTERQKDVWQLFAEGHTVKTIAEVLNVSPKTVEHHMVLLQNNLRTYGAARLTMSAIRNRLITP